MIFFPETDDDAKVAFAQAEKKHAKFSQDF